MVTGKTQKSRNGAYNKTLLAEEMHDDMHNESQLIRTSTAADMITHTTGRIMVGTPGTRIRRCSLRVLAWAMAATLGIGDSGNFWRMAGTQRRAVE